MKKWAALFVVFLLLIGCTTRVQVSENKYWETVILDGSWLTKSIETIYCGCKDCPECPKCPTCPECPETPETPEVPEPVACPTPTGGYIWKPATEAGDHGGNPAFIYPPGQIKGDQGIKIKYADILEAMVYSRDSTAAHSRDIYYGKQASSQYPQNIKVEYEGKCFSIPNPGQRYE